MDCEQCLDDLTSYLDGELDSAGSERIQSHIRTCVSCATELQSLREAADFVESHSADLEPVRGSWELVRARIGDMSGVPTPKFSLFSRYRWLAATVGLLAVVAFGYLQYQQVQQRNLDRYISQYVQQREMQITRQLATESPYEGNPFTEVKATVTGNPFLPEDR